jgi:hypothetical protein
MQKLPVRLADREDAAHLAELPAGLRLAMTGIISSAKEGLLAMGVAVGLRVMAELLEAELAAKIGPKHAKQPGRTSRRHGSAVRYRQPSMGQPHSSHGSPGSRCASSSVGGSSRPAVPLALRAAWQPAHISSGKPPPTSRNGPPVVPQKEHRGPTPRRPSPRTSVRAGYNVLRAGVSRPLATARNAPTRSPCRCGQW